MAKMLHLNLLGKPQVTLGETLLTGFSTAKAEALFYYLAVTGRPYSRELLVDLLWGDMPEAKAKRNLTTTLTTLRKVVGDYLIVEPQTVAFNLETLHQVDVTIFQAAIEGSAALEPEDLERDLAPLRRAVNLYSGDFLEGFYVKNALSFEEWTLEQRERLRELMVQALQYLIEQYGQQPEAGKSVAFEYATRLLALDPWRESAHRQMMILLARRGQRGAALAQYETCRRILAEELGVEPTAETTALYERLKKTQQPVVHNLPSQPNTFVGRVRELNQLATHLDNPDCRLLSLVGAGGIGKTRLAIEGGRLYVQSNQSFEGSTFADGVYLVNLAPIAAPETTETMINPNHLSDLLASAIGDALNHSLRGSADLTSQLLNYLREKEMLLILDNFEHLIEGVDLLAALLQQASQIKLLVTSRERLNLLEEWVIEVEGLDVPDLLPAIEAKKTKLEWHSDLESYSAIALFVRQAQQVRGDFSLPEGEVPHIVRICQLVQGIPLALVLAAGWLRVLSCAEIANEIEKSLDFLSASQRNIPERHRSLRAVFEQSWQMLSDQEQAVFRKISIFRGGFRREAARNVAGAMLPILTGLVDKSLLRLTPSGRYEIHELLRQYAAEQLEATPAENEATQAAHAASYATFLHQREVDLKGSRQLEALAEIAAEIDNIRQSWRWAVNKADLEVLDKSLESLWHFCEIRGKIEEGEVAFQNAVEALTEHRKVQELQAQIILGRLLARRGRLSWRLGRHDQARNLAVQAETVLRQVGSEGKRELAFALNVQAFMYLLHGTGEGRKLTEESLAICAEVGDQWLMAETLLDLCDIAEGNAAYIETIRLAQQSRDIFQQLGDLRHQTAAGNTLGRMAYALGNYSESERHIEEALQTRRAFGDLIGQIGSLTDLGNLARSLGQYQQARSRLLEAVTIAREIGERRLLADALLSLGTVIRLQGEYDQAEQLYQESGAICRELGLQRALALSHYNLGCLAYDQGHFDQAEKLLRESLALWQQFGREGEISSALCKLSQVILSRSQESYAEAQSNLWQALELAQKISATPLILNALMGLAIFRIRTESNDVHQAQAIELLALIQHHPASEFESKEKAQRLLEEWTAGLPPEVIASAKERGQTIPLEVMVEEIFGNDARGLASAI